MTKKTLRRLFTASMTGALTISLASCSAAKDKTGLLPDEVYASAGNYSVTYKELWDELKWDSADIVEEQVATVVLDKYLNAIEVFLSKDAATTDQEKEYVLQTDEEYDQDIYEKRQKKCKDRLVDYVIQDIYSFPYKNTSYWDEFDSLSHSQIDLYEAKWVNKMYTNYGVTIDSSKLKNADYKNYEEKYDTYLELAKQLSQVFYVEYAKELLAYYSIVYDANLADEKDEDDEDSTWGLFTRDQYLDMFKNEYTNNYDLKAITLNFSSEDELNDTLRAFGLKLNNKKLYYIYDSQDSTKYTLTAGHMSYEDYTKYYDEFKTSDLGNVLDSKGNQICAEVKDEEILAIYVQIYNYIYGGYKNTLAAENYGSLTELNDLRTVTSNILSDYASDGTTKHTAAINAVLNKAETKDAISYTADDLKDKYGSSFKTFLYDNMDPANTDIDACYTTSIQSTDAGSTLAYLLSEDNTKMNGEDLTADQTKYATWYNKDRSNSDIANYILDTEANPNLYKNVRELLIDDKVGISEMNTRYDALYKLADVKIYLSAAEIGYLVDHDEYSKVVKKSKNSNLLATISYNDITKNVNIVADTNDADSIKLPGKTECFGVFDYLEEKKGTTTATELIYKKMVLDSDEYKKALADKDRRETFETYVENLLIQFSNDSLSSKGYPAKIGKYNFLMLYYHTADIKEIIEQTYCKDYASSIILTDYSSDSTINFIKKYAEIAQENYFKLTGKRLVVYIDVDDDGRADEDFDWTKAANATQTFEEVAKELLLKIYEKINYSTTAHDTKAQEIIDEYNSSAKAKYDTNPISAENTWAEYKHLGLSVKLEDFDMTNSSLDVDYSIKQRLYDYAIGYNSEDNSIKYEYFVGNTCPTCYIEPIDEAVAGNANNNTFVKSKDGFNMLLVTSGYTNAHAKFTKDEFGEGIYDDFKFIYNDTVITIENLYNNEEFLNNNQIKFYVLDYVLNGSNTLTPLSIQDSCESFLEPLMTKIAGDETQRIFKLSYISSNAELYNAVTFTKEGYNGADGRFNKIIQINQEIADEYLSVYNDTTHTSEIYEYTDKDGVKHTWWDDIKNLIKEA